MYWALSHVLNQSNKESLLPQKKTVNGCFAKTLKKCTSRIKAGIQPDFDFGFGILMLEYRPSKYMMNVGKLMKMTKNTPAHQSYYA